MACTKLWSYGLNDGRAERGEKRNRLFRREVESKNRIVRYALEMSLSAFNQAYSTFSETFATLYILILLPVKMASLIRTRYALVPA